ncbi:MAG TPA: FKBP-type peptidyl-prolyl cis-trans isomerase [Sphingobacteriaceae bacterium]|nr:FKBP-type peptidyl-prolyl cis-trans isomerase [Sphingobacteriaceae bacterium]
MIKINLKYIPVILLAVMFLSACDKEYPGINETDETSIQNYIKANNLNMTKYSINDTSAFYYQVITPGKGADTKYSEVVPLVFTIRTLDGSFNSTDTFSVAQRYGTSNQFLGYLEPQPQGGYPEALRVGVVELLKKRGGKIRLIVPSKSAYGRNGLGPIPGNASLDYTVNVLNEPGIPAYDDISIQKYLQANNLTGFTKTTTGIYYKINNPGTGSSVTVDSTLTIETTGKFFNGNVFQGSSPFSLKLTDAIKGWKEVVPLLKEGGAMRLILPSASGYGLLGQVTPQGAVSIPPVSCLDFDLKITDVKK